ncbi:hypothetical protein CC2G_013821 [Coprinopsis cinerea AmutBmut pab1-1]|nr:hypothetical protein CC2G_013821 [Coprinopsis cinerea AmutBmut pab1-1]
MDNFEKMTPGFFSTPGRKMFGIVFGVGAVTLGTMYTIINRTRHEEGNIAIHREQPHYNH